MNYLCFDPGQKHLGVALSTDGLLAQPLTSINAKDLNEFISKIKPLLNQYQPEVIIIGQPAFGSMVNYSINFQNELKKIFPKDIVLYEEDLSSKMGDKLGKKYQSKHHFAAAFILQDYLDNIRS